MTTKTWLLPTALAAALSAGVAPAQTPAAAAAPATMPDGGAVFAARCKMCHEPSTSEAPQKAELAKLPKADIVAALTTGPMVPMAAGLSPPEIDAVAAYLTSGASAGAPGAPGD